MEKEIGEKDTDYAMNKALKGVLVGGSILAVGFVGLVIIIMNVAFN